MGNTGRLLFLAVLCVLLMPSPAHAYIGPGAGFALAGSFLAVFAAVFSSILLLLTWPVRLVSRALRGQRALAHAPGQAGRDPGAGRPGLPLTEKLLAEGKLPHLAALREQGCFKPLATTVPPISPVAWSSFQTGVNPGKHNIFDFLTPDRHTYQPTLSSVRNPPAAEISSAWESTNCRWAKPTCGYFARANHFGVFWANRGYSIASSACRSLFHLRNCAACNCRRCAFPTSAARKGCFRFTPRSRSCIGEQTGGEVHTVTRERQHHPGGTYRPGESAPHGRSRPETAV